jgi:hypothetical protein
MTESDHSASEVIDAYRKRRERTIPLLLGGVAVVLLAVGLFLVVLWVTGGGMPALPALFASRTPTPSITPSPTLTLTPTITPTPAPSETPSGGYLYRGAGTTVLIAEQFGLKCCGHVGQRAGISDQIFVGQTLIIRPGSVSHRNGDSRRSSGAH